MPETTIYFDLKAYKRHRYNVINAKPKIDNEAPPIDLSVYYDREKMMKNARQVKVICMTNLDTVKKLNKVYRLQVSLGNLINHATVILLYFFLFREEM